MADNHQKFARDLVRRNRYLTMATTDGNSPWIAPLEYISDEDLNLYFFSPATTMHAVQLENNHNVAVAIFDSIQPEYEPAPEIRIAGLQISASAEKLEAPYPALVRKQAQAWKLPMPPYAAYRIVPQRWFVPVIKDGINERIEIAMT